MKQADGPYHLFTVTSIIVHYNWRLCQQKIGRPKRRLFDCGKYAWGLKEMRACSRRLRIDGNHNFLKQIRDKGFLVGAKPTHLPDFIIVIIGQMFSHVPIVLVW